MVPEESHCRKWPFNTIAATVHLCSGEHFPVRYSTREPVRSGTGAFGEFGGLTCSPLPV
jgi:hypothetical protein